MFKNFWSSITRTGISLFGTGLAIASLVLIICLFVIQHLGYDGGPYLGILTFLVLPMIFVVGLLLIPFGVFLYHRSLRKMPGGESVPKLPIFDLNKPKT
ncbi:MAG: hypothetical protein WBN44_11990, partial [Woeseiaceae bacterium]